MGGILLLGERGFVGLVGRLRKDMRTNCCHYLRSGMNGCCPTVGAGHSRGSGRM